MGQVCQPLGFLAVGFGQVRASTRAFVEPRLAATWATARRVVATVEFHCEALFPRVGCVWSTAQEVSEHVRRDVIDSGVDERLERGIFADYSGYPRMTWALPWSLVQ